MPQVKVPAKTRGMASGLGELLEVHTGAAELATIFFRRILPSYFVGRPTPVDTSGSLFSTTELREGVANTDHTFAEPTSNGTESNTNLFTVIPKVKTESEAASN
uniref:Uncharacterized protein n=1 Tax=Daphnia galeata TaxID=27404 RepID=A0A8J2RSM3_9CRUS|nr:unnamed protein product [Daphnia galeata]